MREFLTIDYCLRTMGYCFPNCFLEILWGGKALMEGNKVVMRDAPSLPPLGKTLVLFDDNSACPTFMQPKWANRLTKT